MGCWISKNVSRDILTEPKITGWKLFSLNFLGNTPFSSSFLCSPEKSHLILSFDCFIPNLFSSIGNIVNLSIIIWVLKAHIYKPIISPFLLIVMKLFNVKSHVFHLIFIYHFHDCFSWWFLPFHFSCHPIIQVLGHLYFFNVLMITYIFYLCF